MEDDFLKKKIKNKLKPTLDLLIPKLEYIAYFIVIPYAAIQFLILKKTQKNLVKIFKLCLGLFLTIPWVLISVIVLSVLFLYKRMVITILTFKLKTKFHGLIVGIDSVLTFYEDRDQSVCYAFHVKSLKNEDEFLESLKTRINNEILSPITPKKINCVRKQFLGHLYFEQVDDIDADEILKRISFTKLTGSKLCNKIDSVFQTEAPRNNTFNWDMFWSRLEDEVADSKFKTYVVVLRVHHTLGDAISLYNITSNLLCKNDKAKDRYAEALNVKNIPPKNFTTKIENLFELLSDPKICLIYPPKKGRGIHSFVTESGEISCLQKMKIIRKAVKDVSVVNIIATGYSAALSSYIKRKDFLGSYVPNRALLVTPIQEKNGRFQKYYKNQFCDSMDNDFTYLSYFVPFRNNTEMDIEGRFQQINESICAALNSCDYKITYVIMKSFLELLPNIIAKRMKRVECAGTIGMAPGGPKLNFFNGDELLNVFPFVPAIKVNGVALAVYSYDNRFTFSLAGNSDNFSYQDLTDILNETFYNIDLLYQKFKAPNIISQGRP